LPTTIRVADSRVICRRSRALPCRSPPIAPRPRSGTSTATPATAASQKKKLNVPTAAGSASTTSTCSEKSRNSAA